MSGTIIPGRPIAATRTSAARASAARSAVREWQIVTVAFAARRSIAIGLPASSLRPITTARLPSSSIPYSSSMTITPSGVAGTCSGLPRKSRPELSGWSPSTSLSGSIAAMTRRLVHARERQLHEDAVDPVVGVQLVEHLEHLALLRPLGEPVVARLDARFGGGVVLLADVDVRGRVVADEDRRQADRRAERLDVLRDLRADLLRDELPVDSNRCHAGVAYFGRRRGFRDPVSCHSTPMHAAAYKPSRRCRYRKRPFESADTHGQDLHQPRRHRRGAPHRAAACSEVLAVDRTPRSEARPLEIDATKIHYAFLPGPARTADTARAVHPAQSSVGLEESRERLLEVGISELPEVLARSRRRGRAHGPPAELGARLTGATRMARVATPLLDGTGALGGEHGELQLRRPGMRRRLQELHEVGLVTRWDRRGAVRAAAERRRADSNR